MLLQTTTNAMTTLEIEVAEEIEVAMEELRIGTVRYILIKF